MNRNLFISVAGICFMICGCAGFDEDIPVASGTIPVNIDGGISMTRASADGFADGDAVGIYVVNYTDGNVSQGTLLDEGNQADHVRYVYSASARTWTPSQNVYYKDDKTNVDIYGYYPYSKPESVSAYPFEVEKDQSVPVEGSGLSAYEASDFLWGSAIGIAPSTDKVKITFRHRMACANVILAEGTGFEEGEFDLLEKTVMVMNTTRQATIDISTGTVTPVGEASAEGTVMKKGDDGFRAIVVPQTVGASKPLFSITLGGVPYSFSKDEDFTYPAGQMSKFTITVSRKASTGEYEFALTDTQITAWTEDMETYQGEARQYYVVDVETPGTLGAVIKADGRNPEKIKNLKVTGTIDAKDFYFMRDSMDVLQAINLKEVSIAAFTHVNRDDPPDSPADAIPDQAFEEKATLAYFAFPDNITSIGERAFASLPLFSGALIIPDNVELIGERAFFECEALTSLSLPNSLKKIGDYAFYYCKAISCQLHLPENLEEIGSNAFSECVNLYGTLTLPGKITEIGHGCFDRCARFTGDLRIPENIKLLNQSVFSGCSGLRGQLILHEGLELSEDGYQFSGCSFTGELVLPENLTKIPAGAFSECLFSSIGELPSGLIEIGESAFLGCWRLAGTLTFPEDMVAIGEYAFEDCQMLEGIVIPTNLTLLKNYAFRDCSNLNSIICKASDPPTLLSNVFDGVPKDNFTVEVPEESVNRYQSDSKWGEFKRISAYRDFSLDCRTIRSLGAEMTKEVLVRALSNDSWSVESKPDWVEVSPTSGTGKTEVTVTVNEMAQTSGSRTGEIVFLLNDKDYRARISVEQYGYEYADGDVVTLQTATKGKGVNIVLLGDCYDAADISSGAYLADIEEAYGYFFDVEPYKTYKDYFNVYAVFGLSEDSGVGTVNTIRKAKFGSQYFIAEGVAPDEEVCFEYACKAPINDDIQHTLIILIPNTTEYGGITYMYSDGSAIAVCPKSSDAYPYDFRGIVQHEAGGHGFGKLADEYIFTNAFISSCSCEYKHDTYFMDFKELGWFKNLSLNGNMEEVDWSHLIFHPKYANIVDIYEGGYFHTRGVYRSEPNSCMNNNIPYFSAISRQAIVERIMDYAGETFSLEDFYSKDVLTMTGVSGTTKAPAYGQGFLYGGGKQYAPVFMGESPDFKPRKR